MVLLKRIRIVFVMFISLFMVSASVNAEDDSATNAVEVHGMFQGLGLLEALNDNSRNNDRISLYQRQSLLRVNGNYDDLTYSIEIAFGGEETTKSNTVLSLLDYYVDVPLISEMLYIRVGQFRVPYSRERLVNSGTMQFVDRSINTLGFNVGRDSGFAVHGNYENYTAALGIFTGGGMETPIRYLPQKLGVPMIVLRAGYNIMDKNIFAIDQSPVDSELTKYAIYFNGLYTKDSRIGHSSVLSNKQTDISLLYNKNWNPYLRAITNASQVEIGELMQIGLDCAAQTKISDVLLSAEAEVNHGTYSNAFGAIKLTGSECKIAALYEPCEVALRYAMIIPDKNFGYADFGVGRTNSIWPLVDDKYIYEITPALTIYFKEHHLKLVFDAPMGIDVPVVQEENIGAYNLMAMPDQASLVTTLPYGTLIPRQNTAAIRVMFQFMF